MDRLRDSYGVKSVRKRKTSILTHACGIQGNGTDKPAYGAGREAQTRRTDLWTQRGKQKVGQTGRGGLADHRTTCQRDS